jgi:hypothetical protein
MVFPIRYAGPKEMIIRAPSVRVLPEPAILFKVIDRPRIRIMVVEVSNLLCCIKGLGRVFCSLAHGKRCILTGFVVDVRSPKLSINLNRELTGLLIIDLLSKGGLLNLPFDRLLAT